MAVLDGTCSPRLEVSSLPLHTLLPPFLCKPVMPSRSPSCARPSYILPLPSRRVPAPSFPLFPPKLLNYSYLVERDDGRTVNTRSVARLIVARGEVRRRHADTIRAVRQDTVRADAPADAHAAPIAEGDAHAQGEGGGPDARDDREGQVRVKGHGRGQAVRSSAPRGRRPARCGSREGNGAARAAGGGPRRGP